MDRKIEILVEGQIDIRYICVYIYRQIDGVRERQIERFIQIYGKTGRSMIRQIDSQIDRYLDGQAKRQMKRHIDTDSKIDRKKDRKM